MYDTEFTAAAGFPNFFRFFFYSALIYYKDRSILWGVSLIRAELFNKILSWYYIKRHVMTVISLFVSKKFFLTFLWKIYFYVSLCKWFVARRRVLLIKIQDTQITSDFSTCWSFEDNLLSLLLRARTAHFHVPRTWKIYRTRSSDYWQRKFACAERPGLTSSFNEINGKRRVTAIGSDNTKGIRQAELSILLCASLFLFVLYCSEYIGRIEMKQARQVHKRKHNFIHNSFHIICYY